MHIIKSLSRLGVVLTTLGVVALGFVGRASAASAMVPRSGGGGAEGNGHLPISPPPEIHTVVVGGMPGWQIAAIAGTRHGSLIRPDPERNQHASFHGFPRGPQAAA
jgi:hypothetical protein